MATFKDLPKDAPDGIDPKIWARVRQWHWDKEARETKKRKQKEEAASHFSIGAISTHHAEERKRWKK